MNELTQLMRGARAGLSRLGRALAPLVGQLRRARGRLNLSKKLAVVPIAIMIVGFLGLLTYERYLDAAFKPDGAVEEFGDASRVPASIAEGGPFIDATGKVPVAYNLPPRTIVLTFDDGPDPEWTPQILAVLTRHNVRATFFVIGSEVARNPEIMRYMVSAGHDVGVHTFTHPDMSQISSGMRSLEYSQTQLALAGAAGITTPLLRFPYSAGNDSLDNVTWPLVREAGRQGYIVVTSTVDSQDWQRPGVDEIIRDATPQDGQSAVVLMHDAGGNRAQTIQALDEIIPQLQEHGYQFLTASEALRSAQALAGAPAGTDPAAVDATAAVAADPVLSSASRIEIWRGKVLVWSVSFADSLFGWLGIAVLAIGVLMLVRTAAMFFLAGRHARRRRAPDFSWGPPVTRPVSVIMPAYNEQENIAAAVQSIACGDYPGIEVVVVDDGSTDDTAKIVANLGLPNVRLITIPNGGKANALNVGIAHASHDIIVMIDGDTVFEPGSLRTLVQPFADATVGGVAGNVKVINRDTLIGRWQHIEYVIGFNLDRRLYELMGCMPTIPGAIGAFRRQALRDAGGVSDRTLAEDTDLTMGINRAGWKVVYEEKAIAWTEAPHDLRQLWRQRYRWSYGTMQAMWTHRGALRERGPSGRFGRLGLPFLAVFGIVFPMLAPLIDILTLYGVVVQHSWTAGGAWLIMLAIQFATAAVAFKLDGEDMEPLWSLPLQQVVYRQLIYLILLKSMMTAMTGVALRWQKLHRTGAAAAHLQATAR